MKSKVGSVFIVAIAFGMSTQTTLAESFLKQGIEAYNQGKYSDAIGLLGGAKSSDSDNPVLHYYMANALVRMNYKTEAIREYKIAIDLEPQGKLADYCRSALRSLGAAPAEVVKTNTSAQPAKSPAKSADSNHPPAREIRQTQQPQLVAVLCGCPLCHRLDLILTDLHTKYGDEISFVRTMQNAADEKTKDIIKQYRLTECPSILLIDGYGSGYKQYTGIISESELWKEVGQLATTSQHKQFSNPDQERISKLSKPIIDEVNARIGQDQLRVDAEIKAIQNEASESIAGIPHQSSRSQSATVFQNIRAEQSQQIQNDADRRIQLIKDDFEKKKREWYAAAQAKIEALESTQSSTTIKRSR